MPVSKQHVPGRPLVDVGPLCAAFVGTANLSSNSGEVLRVQQELASFDDDLSLNAYAFQLLSDCCGDSFEQSAGYVHEEGGHIVAGSDSPGGNTGAKF